MSTLIETATYFDGQFYHSDGPYFILIDEGIIIDVYDSMSDTFELPEFIDKDSLDRIFVAFVMPGLTEAHCHIFLDGDELDMQKRSDYLKRAEFSEMLNVAKNNITKYLDYGVTLIRDAGDIHGVNVQVYKDLQGTSDLVPKFRKPGKALRKKKRYGSFMATEVDGFEEIPSTIKKLAKDADDLKILLTGIIDFEMGIVKGKPQFTLEETKLIVKEAKDNGLLTYAHCSGLEGLEIIVETGIHSVEHGFFMNKEILEKMLEKDIAWVPTFSPVYFQWDQPEHCGWNDVAVNGLRKILDNHNEHQYLAAEMGVSLVAGSDAGSFGVPHGKALIDELIHMANAGVPVTEVLKSATHTPRRLWSEESADIKKGDRVDLIVLEGSPFDELENLYKTSAVFLGNKIRNINLDSEESTLQE